jgi:hypothetical protein
MISDRGLSVRDAESMPLPKLLKYAEIFADLDDYRAKNSKKRLGP